MIVCMNDRELNAFAAKAAVVNKEHPVVVSKFIEGAKEVEFDGVAQKGKVLISAIAEHIEFAGVHSGDATIAYPAPTLSPEERSKVQAIGLKLVRALRVTGPVNIQFLVKNGEVSVIETNVRASRTFPLLSKASGVNFAEEIVAAFYGKGRRRAMRDPKYMVVKSPQFSFSRLTGADPVLRVEMASTGEVAAFGVNLHEALLTSILASTSFKGKPRAALLSVGGENNKRAMLDAAEMLRAAKFKIYATEGTADFFQKSGIAATTVHKNYEKGRMTALSLIEQKKVSFVVNVSDKEGSLGVKALRSTDGYLLRRAAVDQHIPLFTDLNLARAFLTGLKRHPLGTLPVRSWNEYLAAAKPKKRG
jgi:carbamoyl-phosphate synthase large subunit